MSGRAAILTILLAAAGANAQTARPQTPVEYLAAMIADAKEAHRTLVTLHSTRDKDLAPAFAALTRSGDKQRRLYGVLALAELVGKDAAPALLARLETDPVMAVRAAALARLIEMKAVATEKLAAALRVADENVQSLAARELVRRQQVPLALPTLEKLAASKDAATSSLARMCLLGLGRREQEAPLQKVMRDPRTSSGVLILLLRQIEEQRIKAATGLALHVAASDDPPGNVRARAYRAVSAVSAIGAITLRDAILNSRRTVFRAQLVKILAGRPDAGRHLQAVVKAGGPIAALARFELARKTGGPTAAGTVTGVLALEHPVLVAYVLDRAGEDINAARDRAGYYAAGLLAYIRSVDPKPARMGKEHYFAAGATSRLIELGTPAAIAGLRRILAGKKDARTRSVAAGLLRSTNPAASDLARPLLTSPYQELATDAALVLGHQGDPAAAAYLGGILANPKRHEPPLVVLASWYLLRISKQTRPAAAALARRIK